MSIPAGGGISQQPLQRHIGPQKPAGDSTGASTPTYTCYPGGKCVDKPPAPGDVKQTDPPLENKDNLNY